MVLNILLFNQSDYLIEEVRIEKPKTYNDLLDNILKLIKYLPNNYEIYFLNNHQNMLLNNKENYKLVKNIIFINEINNQDELVLSQSQKEEKNEIEDKYTCSICKEKITEDKPLLCYQCQAIYHKKCLKKWDKACILQQVDFSCPKCKFNLPLSDWKEKINYKEEINNESISDNNKNKNKKIIKDNKIDKNQYDILKKEYKMLINKNSKILEIIHKKSYDIISLLTTNNNNIINNSKKNNFNDLYNMIIDHLIIVENYVKYQIIKKKEKINDINEYMPNEINCIYVPKENETEIELIHDYSKEFTFSTSTDYGIAIRNIYLRARELNIKIFKDDTKLYVNDKKVKFDFRLKVKGLREIKVRFKFSKVFCDTSYLFYQCPSLKHIDFSLFNTINIKHTSGMFGKCTSLESINFSSFYTVNVTNMCNMFYHCDSLKSADFSLFNTSNVTDMSYMFQECSSLESLDLFSFNTSKVVKMFCMFDSCVSLKSIDVTSFNTKNVKEMGYMFQKCKSLKKIDLSLFNSSNAKSTFAMFSYCFSLESIDLSSFIITKDMSACFMFSDCTSLKYLVLYSFEPKIDSDLKNIFKKSSSLKKENIIIKDNEYYSINLIFNNK